MLVLTQALLRVVLARAAAAADDDDAGRGLFTSSISSLTHIHITASIRLPLWIFQVYLFLSVF